MRELKFRAWDGNAMSNPFSVGVRYAEFPYPPPIRGIALKEIRELEVMQYTGLKDRNGKEVFDGDIVRCSLGPDKQGCPHRVEWREEIGGKYFGGMPGWYLSGLLSGGGEGYAWTGEEVCIGNVYESPELLEAK